MTQEQYLLLSLVAGPVVMGLLSLLIPSKRAQWWIFFLTVFAAGATAYTLKGSHVGVQFALPYFWLLPSKISFGIQPLGFFFVLITLAATMMFALFSLGFNDRKHATRVAPLWAMLVGASNGIFLARDWFTFFIVWETMSWTSLLIIGHGKKRSFNAGVFYYVLSLAGTFLMLLAMWVLYKNTNTFDINLTVTHLANAENHAYVITVITLFTIAFMAKSAIFPFQIWPALAHAEAPDDFSPYLSGVMIKYGFYGLLLVVVPVLTGNPGAKISGVPVSLYILGWISLITAILGTVVAIFTNDMKRLMAWSTVANVGYIGTALATGSPLGYAAALFHTANHMIFKGAIFASLASVKFRTGEREMHRLGGLAYRMPVTFFTFLLGIIAAAGIPPLSGFNSKWMIFQALFQKKLVLQATGLFFASTGAFLYLFRALHTVFLGQLPRRLRTVREAPLPMSLAMILMMIAMLGVGMFPGVMTLPISRVMAAMGIGSIDVTASVINGATSSINTVLIGSVFGIAIFFVLVLYLIGGRTYRLRDDMDNYSAGEDPREWGVFEAQYHYGYKFYQAIEPLFRWVPQTQPEELYRTFNRALHRFGSFIDGLWRPAGSLGWSIVFGIVFMILFGVVL